MLTIAIIWNHLCKVKACPLYIRANANKTELIIANM